MKTLKEELTDFKIWWKNKTYDYISDVIIDEYLKEKSVNSNELREPEADGCNKQTQEVCACCGLSLDKGYVHSKCTYETFNSKS